MDTLLDLLHISAFGLMIKLTKKKKIFDPNPARWRRRECEIYIISKRSLVRKSGYPNGKVIPNLYKHLLRSMTLQCETFVSHTNTNSY